MIIYKSPLGTIKNYIRFYGNYNKQNYRVKFKNISAHFYIIMSAISGHT